MNAVITEQPTLGQELDVVLTSGDREALSLWLEEHAEQDIASALSELPHARWRDFFHQLAPEDAAEIFAHFPTDLQTGLLENLEAGEATLLLSELSYDDAVAVLDELDEAHADSILQAMPDEEQLVIEALLSYPEESAGRLMTPEYAVIRPEWTVAEALEHLREHSEVAETVNTIFVVTPERRITGWLRLKELLLSRPQAEIHAILHSDTVTIEAHEDQEEAARRISHYDLDVLPVVDREGRLLGIITVDDVLDVIRAETTEDFHRMAAVGNLPLSLRDASMKLLYRKRVGWLVILVLVNILSGTAIAFFEASIEAVVALVFFLPMVIASGGNAGAQASTLMVRALATGDAQLRDWWRLGAKEMLVASSLGLTLAGAIWLTGNWLGNFDVANAIAVAMFLVVIFGSMFGMTLPFLLTRLGLDPATASAPLITSVVDVVGIVIYFGVATTLLALG